MLVDPKSHGRDLDPLKVTHRLVIEALEQIVGPHLVGVALVGALEHGAEFLTRPVDELMGGSPKVVEAGCLASEALQLMRSTKVDQLPVIDTDGLPIGLIDVQDLVDARVT